MNNSKKMLILIFAVCAVVLAAAGSVMLIMAISGEYDISIGHFATDAIFAPISYGIMVVGFVLSIVIALLTGKTKIKPGKNAGAFLSFASVFASILLFAAVVFGFFDGSLSVEASYQLFVYLAAVFGIGGAVGLFMFALSGSYRTGLSKLLSMCLPLYFIMRTLILYLDKTGAINSPVKVITQIAFIAFALFAVFDTGVYVGREKILPRYLFGCTLAITIGGAVSIAALISQFIVEGCFDLSVVDTCMMLAFFLLACAKIHHIAFSVAEELNEETEEVLADNTNKTADTAEVAEEAKEKINE